MNLAPWKYRNIHEERGGPIAELVHHTQNLWGGKMFAAHATLRSDLRGDASMHSFGLYGDVDGSGTDPLLHVAKHKAISEALERWAVRASRREGHTAFRYDPSSSGVAAYPALTTGPVRGIAYVEAIERFSLLSWWLGFSRCSLSELGEGRWECRIQSPNPKVTVVVLCERIGTAHCPTYVYGFAAGWSLRAAQFNAQKELARNRFVLSQPPTGPLALEERRLVFFSTPSGFECWHARATEAHSNSTNHTNQKPELDVLFDGEIRGPWSKYATVWRIVVRQPQDLHLSEAEDLFLF